MPVPLVTAASAVLLGIGVGWHHTAVALITTALILVLSLSSTSVSQLAPLALVPLTAWWGIPWPLPALAAVAAAVALGWRPVGWWYRGNQMTALTASATLTLGCSISWWLTQSQMAAHPLLLHTSRPPGSVILAAVVGAAAGNSVAEEVLWRGLVLDRMLAARFTTSWVVALQASAFGLSHYGGAPSGWPGVIAAAIFSGALTILRLKIGLVPVTLVHLCVDTAIFVTAAQNMIYIDR